ncbi:subclass B3 metallo-beta-lactamase [Qipengyuania mesophila]|uniref:subclass B3 metallo-beta-lactamase n=1 Tax=Qipengyuania mesophila TaxID=2867246 RepID=UPI00351805B8
MSARIFGFALALISAACTTTETAEMAAAAEDAANAAARRAWVERCTDFDEWDKPAPPFRIYGDTYYVGTCGISAILVVGGPEGDVLIDTGTEKGAEIVLANIRALGFDPRNVRSVFISHEHFDHVGGMARFQAATGAKVTASAPAAAVLRTGHVSVDDPQAGSGHPPFSPVEDDALEVLDPEGRTITAAGHEFVPIATPGHTLGATSWTWEDCEGGECKRIVYVDSMNPISDDTYRFSDHPALLAAFRKGVADIAALDCDIVLAPHPSAAKMRERLLGEAPLVDRSGCRAYAAAVAQRLDQRLAKERGDD